MFHGEREVLRGRKCSSCALDALKKHPTARLPYLFCEVNILMEEKGIDLLRFLFADGHTACRLVP
jgi:hypothetical protein